MAKRTLDYDEILSYFKETPPPLGLDKNDAVFSAICQRPLDMSAFEPKQFAPHQRQAPNPQAQTTDNRQHGRIVYSFGFNPQNIPADPKEQERPQVLPQEQIVQPPKPENPPAPVKKVRKIEIVSEIDPVVPPVLNWDPNPPEQKVFVPEPPIWNTPTDHEFPSILNHKIEQPIPPPVPIAPVMAPEPIIEEEEDEEEEVPYIPQPTRRPQMNQVLNEAKRERNTVTVEEPSIQITQWNAPKERDTSSVPFNNIFEAEKAKKGNNVQKIAPLKGKAKPVVLSYQELQQSLNKPAQWNELAPATAAKVPSMKEILQEKQSQNPGATTNLPKKKGKKVVPLDEYLATSKPPAANTPAFQPPSMNALIQAEIVRESRPPPTTAPNQGKKQHKRGKKEVIDVAEYYEEEEVQSSWNMPSSQVEPISLRNIEAKQKPKQMPPVKKGSGKVVMDISEFNQMNKPAKSQWNPVTNVKATPIPEQMPSKKPVNQGSIGGKSKKAKAVPFDQFMAQAQGQSNPIAKNQTNKTSFAEIEEQEMKSTVTSEPIRMNKDKKKAKVQTYSLQDYVSQISKPSKWSQQNESKAAPKKPGFMELYNEEQKRNSNNVQPTPQQSQSISYNATAGARSNKPSFTQLQQEEEMQKRNQESFQQPSGPKVHQESNFEKLWRDEQEQASQTRYNNIYSEASAPIGSKPGLGQKKKKKPRVQDEDLFWGAAHDDDLDYDDDDDANLGGWPTLNANQRASYRGNGRNATSPQAYLAQLIERQTGDTGLEEFAEVLITKSKEDMIRSLMTINLNKAQAFSIADNYFKKYGNK